MTGACWMPDDVQFNYSAVWSNDGKRLVMLRGYVMRR